MRRMLLSAPLFALLWGGAAFAGKGQDKGQPPPPDPGRDTLNRCMMQCQKPFMSCSEKCKGKGACNAKCAQGLGDCVEQCGVTPPPKQ